MKRSDTDIQGRHLGNPDCKLVGGTGQGMSRSYVRPDTVEKDYDISVIIADPKGEVGGLFD